MKPDIATAEIERAAAAAGVAYDDQARALETTILHGKKGKGQLTEAELIANGTEALPE